MNILRNTFACLLWWCVLISGAAQAQGRAQPDWLDEYPRSVLVGEHLNPLDQVTMPLSQPGQDRVARYNARLTGRVVMLAFNHANNESPMLILGHYKRQLQEQGYTGFEVCQGCERHWSWAYALIPNNAVDVNHFPTKPTIWVGYKDGALALVAVGGMNNIYSSFIKVVEGQFTDRQDLDVLLRRQGSTTPQGIAAPVPASAPARDAASPSAATGPSRVEHVKASEMIKAIRTSKEKLFVLVTTTNPQCRPCLTANRKFDQASRTWPTAARFLSWDMAAVDKKEDRSARRLVRSLSLWSYPTHMVWDKAQLVHRFGGDGSPERLIDQLTHGQDPSGGHPEYAPLKIIDITPEQLDSVMAENPMFTLYVSLHPSVCSSCTRASERFERATSSIRLPWPVFRVIYPNVQAIRDDKRLRNSVTDVPMAIQRGTFKSRTSEHKTSAFANAWGGETMPTPAFEFSEIGNYQMPFILTGPGSIKVPD